MLKNYLKIAIRTLIRNKTFTSINVLGLTVSLTICLLIIKIIVNIYSCDRFHKDKKNTYRVVTQMHNSPFQNNLFATSSSVLAQEVPGITGVNDVVRIWNKFYDFGKASKNPLPVNGYFADQNFFEFFDFELEFGNAQTVLQEPYSIVLSHEMSLKLFDTKNAVGKTISFKDYGDFKVTGVIADIRYKSHMKFEAVASALTLPMIDEFDYLKENSNSLEKANHTHTYLKLAKGASPAIVAQQINDLVHVHKKGKNPSLTYQLQHLNDISPGQVLGNSLGSVDEKPILLSIVAFILILTSGFTYNNLSVAKSISRAKEVGIRKVHGAKKKQLFIQFILEAIIISLLSLIIAKFLLDLITPFIRSLDEGIASLVIEQTDPIIYLYFVAFAILLGIITGAFPAWYISRFQPVSIVKGIQKISRKNQFSFKKSIIVFQFFLSFMLLFTIIVLFKQFTYQEKIDLGFNPKNIINVELQGTNFQNFSNVISTHNGIEAVAASSLILGTGRGASKTIIYHNDSPDSLRLGFLHVSQDYLQNMEIVLLAGRYFGKAYLGTDKGVVINKKLSEQLAYTTPIDAIGNSLGFGKQDQRTIIGVVDDFVVNDLSIEVEPLIIAVDVLNPKYAAIRLKENVNEAAFITFMEKSWKDLEPFIAISHNYHTNEIEDYHSYSASIMKFLGVVTTFIIIIAILGLLGMVMYDASSRTKEIGLRKTMGAKVSNVLWTLAKGYFMMILIASFIAAPLSWIINEHILQQFSHRVVLNPLWFITAICFMILIGAITTFSQTYKTANQNPVDTLRCE